MKIVVFLAFLNAGAELLRWTGIARALGDPNPGAAQKLTEAVSAASEIQAGGGLGETLFSLYLSIARSFQAVVTAVTGGPTMLINIGVPEALLAFLFAPLIFLIARDITYILIGRSV